MNLQSRIRAEDLSTELAAVLEVRIIFRHRLGVGQVSQAVLQQAVAGVVQDPLGLLLEQLQGVEGGGGRHLGGVAGREDAGSDGGRGVVRVRQRRLVD